MNAQQLIKFSKTAEEQKENILLLKSFKVADGFTKKETEKLESLIPDLINYMKTYMLDDLIVYKKMSSSWSKGGYRAIDSWEIKEKTGREKHYIDVFDAFQLV